MKYNLRTAADACGISKTAIHNAIKSGKLSAPKNEKGSYEIDPAELHRVFPPVQQGQEIGQTVTDRNSIENDYLRDKVALLEGMLEDMKGDRDHWRRQATALLTHQPANKPEAAPDPAKQETAKRPKKRGFLGMFRKT